MFFWKSRKIAITGATGFLGHHTALELRQQGAEVLALVRASSDISRLMEADIACRTAALDDLPALKRALAGCEMVVHLAGAVGFTDDWEMYYRVNVIGTKNLLEAARQAGLRRFVHTSSIVAVAATPEPVVLDESSPWNLRKYQVPYVTTKRRAEDAALAANGRDLEVVVVNPASVVGPDDFSGSEFGTLCKRFWRRRIPFHFGGGNNFVDVRDVACGIRLAAAQGRCGERYLLAGENCTYAEFFRQLGRVSRRFIPRIRLPNGLAKLIGYANDRWLSGSTRRTYLSMSQAALMGLYFYFDSQKARDELGYETRPLAESLADTHAFWMAPTAVAA